MNGNLATNIDGTGRSTGEIACSPREQRRSDMRQRILSAARHVFTVAGYRMSTMRQIAAECGITDPAIYYYFRSKQELLDALMDAVIDSPVPTPSARGELPPLTRQRLNDAVDVMLDSIAEQVLVTGPILRESFRPVLDMRLQRWMAWREFLGGQFDERFDEATIELLTESMCTLLIGLFYRGRIEHEANWGDVLRQPVFRSWVHDLLVIAVPFERYLPATAAK